MREEAHSLSDAEDWFDKHTTGIWCVDEMGDEQFCNTLKEAEEFFD